ncbi:MAG: sodium:solute symporter [bacterium]|nr:sodium:solute symporter [bacterium]
MLNSGLVLITSAGYLALLFLLAFFVNRLAVNNKSRMINSPLIYTLSLTVYCTSWTFYGAVGSAARNGLEFLTIYIGPSLVFFGWWFILRKLVRISKSHHITSIADFISSRYGKSAYLAALVTIMAVIGTTPYIALQLKAVATSFNVITEVPGLPIAASSITHSFYSDTGFWVAASMGIFLVLFGTRTVGVEEHHHGVVAAIAIESLVKLFAFLAVGLFVMFSVRAPGGGNILSAIALDPALSQRFSFPDQFGPRWLTMLILSASAIICLPRQFQITVVEIANERNLQKASWLFPLYLLLISLFVIPIAVAGLTILPAGSNPDQFLLTVPLALGYEELSLLAFIGGFSSATSMMMVASMALSIMISNHLVMPLLLRLRHTELERGADFTGILLTIRRISIVAILILGYMYYRFSTGSDALASIGLIAFAASAQFLPVIIGGIFWKNGTEFGAFTGLSAGFIVWAFTLLVPVFEHAGLVNGLLENGLYGIAFLRPEALFGATGWDPLVHSVFWSYCANIGIYIFTSLISKPGALERLQGSLFVDVFKIPFNPNVHLSGRSVRSGELVALSQRILGTGPTQKLFHEYSEKQGVSGLPEPDASLVAAVERQMAGSIGAASARIMVSRVVEGEDIGIDEMIEILDETQQLIAYSHQLEQKSQQLEETTARLRAANDQLKRMDRHKDDFLSHVSHELRTPMTSIRSFSEILLDTDNLDGQKHEQFLKIIVSESQRLTRLLDEILDINLLENDYGPWEAKSIQPSTILREAIASLDGLVQQKNVMLSDRSTVNDWSTHADPDRLKQVYINILSNAIKFSDQKQPRVSIDTKVTDGSFSTIISDNGPGIAPDDQSAIFAKYQRIQPSAQGIGLGLAISKQIITRMKGSIDVSSKQGQGAVFTVTIPNIQATK